MYCVACFIFFFIGGLLALLMRTELAAPGLQFLSNEQFNQLFTMHGTIMLLFYATPIVFGFANLVLPLQIGAPDVAFPAAERLLVLAVLVRRPDRDGRLHHPRRRRRLRLDRLHPADRRHPLTRSRRRPVDHGHRRRRSGHHPGRGQHDHHRGLHARARHDDVPDADLHLEHPGDVDPDSDRVPAADRRAVRAGRRPAPGRPRLRPGQRRSAVVAAPVLVLRPPRGLHHRAAVLRDRDRDLPGVFPQADLRLHHAGLRDAVDRRVVGGGVGAPHVRHRSRSAAVLFVHDVSDRGADRDQVLQLDRHNVEGAVDL